MYKEFYGLTRRPFNMTPDPAFLYLTEQHREALAGMSYAVLDRKGFIQLSGMAGAGKTTLLAWVLAKLPVDKIQSSVILNPTLSPSEFLELAMLDFGITDIAESKARRIWALQQFLVAGSREGKISLLVVDEAHKLSPEVLEEIRLLGNLEYGDEKLLQVLLIGQSELDELLSRPELWQFKQRIAVRLLLEPLSRAEVAQYVQHRWEIGGGKMPAPFAAEAVNRLYRLSKGIPRLINSICDNALIMAFAERAALVSAEHMETAAQDLALTERPAGKPEAVVDPAPMRDPGTPQAPALTSPAPPRIHVPTFAAKAVALPSVPKNVDSARKSSVLSRWIHKLGLSDRPA